MPIIACGINHKTAPVALREKVVFPPEKQALYLQDLTANENVREAVILSTCNRSELYCDSNDASKLIHWFARQHNMSVEDLRPIWQCQYDQAAIQHIMNVACGLDSMILGEPQILGQMKEAFSEACAAGSIGPQFNRLFQQVFSVAKEVRTNTAIGACPVSIASAAVNLAKQMCPTPLNKTQILLLGAGDTIQLVLRYLQHQTLSQNIIIASRTHANAQMLATKFGVESCPLNEMPRYLSTADIVIAATGSAVPVITQSILLKRQKPIYLIDIAVPRDVEPSVANLQNIYLYTIDDLKNIIQHNLQGREHAAEKAQEIIQKKTAEFMLWLDSIDKVTSTIRAYRQHIEALRDGELSKALLQLDKGDDPARVLASFAHVLTNKLLHTPSVQLRQAGVEGRLDLLQLAQELFAIPKVETV